MQYIPHSHTLGRQTFTKNIFCDICDREGGNPGAICYSCPSCDIDICEGCYNQVMMIDPNMKHNHELKFEKKNFICDLCDNTYNNTVSMSCSRCDFDICLKCFILI